MMSNPEENCDEMCFVCLQKPSTNPSISLHRIPLEENLKLLWMEACGLSEEDYTTERKVCSQHFTNDCFVTLKTKRYLRTHSVPSIFDTGNSNASVSTGGLAEEEHTTERSVYLQQFTNNCFNMFNVKRNMHSEFVPVIFNTNDPNIDLSNLNPALLHVMKLMNKPNQKLVRTDIERFPIFILKIKSPGNPYYPVKWFCYVCSTFILSENAVKLHLEKCPPPRNLDSRNAREPVDEHRPSLPHLPFSNLSSMILSDSD